jgi:hypothetical protein
MCLLSKSEIQFLQGQKQISKSYEYKLKSIIKKKISILLDKEIPLEKKLYFLILTILLNLVRRLRLETKEKKILLILVR